MKYSKKFITKSDQEEFELFSNSRYYNSFCYGVLFFTGLLVLSVVYGTGRLIIWIVKQIVV
jgi:hypothetical protein